MAAAFDENPGAERDRIFGAAAEFSGALSATSEDPDFKRAAVALGSEHIFVPGSAKEKLARCAQRREKNAECVAPAVAEEGALAPTARARGDAKRPAQMHLEHGRP